MLRVEEPNIRIERISKVEYALVYDELVGLKAELFSLYPELQRFLKEYHKRGLTGETKAMKNDYGEWEKEPMYAYKVGDFQRDWCTYTAYCNGFLMQTPAAIGATMAMSNIIEKYQDSDNVIPLAFIHDEIIFEVKDDKYKFSFIEDIANILIDSMQDTLPYVRITVEASLMDYWKKSGGEWEKTYSKAPKIEYSKRENKNG